MASIRTMMTPARRVVAVSRRSNGLALRRAISHTQPRRLLGVEFAKDTEKEEKNVHENETNLEADIRDPNMNGEYPDLPAIKRQFRDPYYPWDDPQQRRNYNEPVHEDDDILGMLTPYEYTHFKPGWGAVLLGTFVATVFGVAGITYFIYPDKPSAPRTFEGGLEKELGGPMATRARTPDEDKW